MSGPACSDRATEPLEYDDSVARPHTVTHRHVPTRISWHFCAGAKLQLRVVSLLWLTKPCAGFLLASDGLPGVVGGGIEEVAALSLVQLLAKRRAGAGGSRSRVKLVSTQSCCACTPPEAVGQLPLVWDVDTTGDAERRARHEMKMRTKHHRSIAQAEAIGLRLGTVEHVECLGKAAHAGDQG